MLEEPRNLSAHTQTKVIQAAQLRASLSPFSFFTRWNGQMSWAFLSHFERSWDSKQGVQTLVDSNQWLKNWYLSFPSQVFDIIRVGLRVMMMWLSGILGHGAGSLVSQWSSTKRLTLVCTATSRYPPWHDFRCCQDVKLWIINQPALNPRLQSVAAGTLHL